MLGQDHLTLRLTRLPGPEAWRQPQGLAFLFPRSGSGSCVSGRQTEKLAAGEVAVVGGSEPWKVSAPERGELVFWEFSVKVEHLFPLFASEEIALLQGVVQRFKGVRLFPATSAVAMECHRLISELPPQFNLGHRSQLLHVATTVLSEEFKDARPHRNGFVRIEEHLMQAFEKLSTEDLLSLSVSELAARFGCSRRHLSRLFHQYFGLSVVALRMEMRLLKAVSLLRDPDAKIIHVAEQSGFNHLGLFNTCFRKRFGTSPGQWRKLRTERSLPTLPLAANTSFCPLQSNGFCPRLGESLTGALPVPGHHGRAPARPVLARPQPTPLPTVPASLAMARTASARTPAVAGVVKTYGGLGIAGAAPVAAPARTSQSPQL